MKQMITTLLSTDDGRQRLVDMIDNASYEINEICRSRHGCNFALDALSMNQAVEVIADGIALHRRLTNIRNPYVD